MEKEFLNENEHAHREGRVSATCDWCFGTYKEKRSLMRKQVNHFCSKPCFIEFKKHPPRNRKTKLEIALEKVEIGGSLCLPHPSRFPTRLIFNGKVSVHNKRKILELAREFALVNPKKALELLELVKS